MYVAHIVDSFLVLKIMLICAKILQSAKMSRSFPTLNLKNLHVASRQNIRKICRQDRHGLLTSLMWVNFNCPPVRRPCLPTDSECTPTLNLKAHQLHEFAICTSSQGGNERWELISKLVQFTGVHFSDLNPNSWQLKQYEIRFKCLHQGQI